MTLVAITRGDAGWRGTEIWRIKAYTCLYINRKLPITLKIETILLSVEQLRLNVAGNLVINTWEIQGHYLVKWSHIRTTQLSTVLKYLGFLL